MIKKGILGVLLLWSTPYFAQVFLQIDTLEEVVVINHYATKSGGPNAVQMSASLEETLDRDADLDLIRRGGYAAEVVYHGLSGTQTNTMIDGMRIYGACTDKMDPVTAYVDEQNLHSLEKKGSNDVTIHSLNLKLKRGEFVLTSKHYGSFYSSVNSNNLGTRYGGQYGFNSMRLWLLVNANGSRASNYSDGSNREVRFTQYEKFNAMASVGLKLGRNEFSATLVKDKAVDVGYAGLPMDVSSADALIARFEHQTMLGNTNINHQVYYNSIVHVMDDTKRDSVAMHMDMPGWSETKGISGRLNQTRGNWLLRAQYELVQNSRRAEMTMYPENEAEMYMETWPEVVRSFASVNPSATYYFNENYDILVSASLSTGVDKMQSPTGIKQLEVFGYTMPDGIQTNAGAGSARIRFRKSSFEHQLTLKAGNRAPELSERFGFYLYNSQDGFNYIGNPDLKNEQFLHVSDDVKFDQLGQQFYAKAYAYLFDQYIFGVQEPAYFAMTPGGGGVKIYENIGKAFILGGELGSSLFQSGKIPTTAVISYRYGRSERFGYLPQMSPLAFTLNHTYTWKKLQFGLSNKWVNRYNRASLSFGERNAKNYWLMDATISTNLPLKSTNILVELAGNNLLNQYYTTHLSWNGIPLMGRNISLMAKWSF